MRRGGLVMTLVLLRSSAGCAGTVGASPHDMSKAQHEAAASREAQAATTQADEHEAAKHRQAAVDHRAASAALTQTEANACAGLTPVDRNANPFAHREDISSVENYYERGGSSRGNVSHIFRGAKIHLRAAKGLTKQWLQQVIDCHLARNAVRGHAAPDMVDCPLAPQGVSAKVEEEPTSFAVSIRADDATTAAEICTLSYRLIAADASTCNTRL